VLPLRGRVVAGLARLAAVLGLSVCLPRLRNVFIQPGAGDEQLVAVCEALGLRVHEGCVLVEMH